MGRAPLADQWVFDVVERLQAIGPSSPNDASGLRWPNSLDWLSWCTLRRSGTDFDANPPYRHEPRRYNWDQRMSIELAKVVGTLKELAQRPSYSPWAPYG